MKKIIPVVFAANDKYVPYLGVALFSLINHASKENEYQIYILNADISTMHMEKLLQLKKDNIYIHFYDISRYMEGINIGTVAHLSQETAYRLLIDQLFSDYKKILYLDSDIVIRKDVAKLYEIDLRENVLGAVRGRLFPPGVEYIQKTLGLDIQDYFNAGILLINVELFRELKIGREGLAMLSKRCYATQDQDVLNLLCAGKVLFIDGRWNVEWEHLTGSSRKPVIDEVREGTLEYIYDPYIVHYTSPIKPWAHPEITLADYFWDNARKTTFYEEILYQNLVSQELWNHYLFPWRSVKPHSRIILYGYGNVGHIFYEQIRKTRYCELVAVCDRNLLDGCQLAVPTIQMNEVKEYNFDYIVIAIEQEHVMKEIKADLLKLGFSESEIVWESPIR